MDITHSSEHTVAYTAQDALGLITPPPLDFDGNIALFLDFDGTLVEIADHPDKVIIATYLPTLLIALSKALNGRAALITGRSIAAIEHLTGTIDMAIAGSHGGEFRPSGTAPVIPLAAPLPDAVISQLRQFAQQNGDLLIEPKSFSIAVHYRHNPEVLERLLPYTKSLATEFGLGLQHGKMVIELAMPGSDKGTAVDRFMSLPDFQGCKPIFLGDDVTDEDAFHAVRRLDGDGVLVGPLRETAAKYHLFGVAEVHQWLRSAFQITQKGDALG